MLSQNSKGRNLAVQLLGWEIRIRFGFEDLLSVTGRVRCQEKQTLMSIEHAKRPSLKRHLPEIERRGLNKINNLRPAAKELFQ